MFGDRAEIFSAERTLLQHLSDLSDRRCTSLVRYQESFRPANKRGVLSATTTVNRVWYGPQDKQGQAP